MNQIQKALEKVKTDKGAFFVARLTLRLSFDVTKELDSAERVEEIRRVSKEMGYELVLH